MSRLCVLICRQDDEEHPERWTPLQRIDLPAVAADQLTPETALEELEGRTLAAGQQVMRHLLEQQWQAVDEQCVADLQRLFPPGSGAG
jgi:hypothetical protein